MRKLVIVGILVLAMSGLALAQDFPKNEFFGGYSYLRNDLADSTSWLAGYYNSDFGTAGKGNGHGFEVAYTRNLNKWFGIKADFSTHFGKVKMDASDVYSYDYPDEYYNEAHKETYNQKGTADFRQYMFLFGPEISLRKYDTFRPYAHVLFGFTHIDVHKINLSYTDLYECDYCTPYFETDSVTGKATGRSFAFAVGGGVDIKLNNKVSLRLPQIDYVRPTLRSFKVDLTDKYDEYYGTNTSGEHYYTNTDKYSMMVPTNVFNNIRISAGIVFGF